jgi:hypothetical protein
MLESEALRVLHFTVEGDADGSGPALSWGMPAALP